MASQCFSENVVYSTVAADDDIRGLYLQPCTSLIALTVRMSFLAEPWSSLPFNQAIFTVASRIISSAPSSLRTLTFSIALDGKAETEDVFVRPFEQRISSDATWLASLHAELPFLERVVWHWRALSKQPVGWDKRKPGGLLKTLSGIVKEHLAPLDKRGMLMFENDFEDE